MTVGEINSIVYKCIQAVIKDKVESTINIEPDRVEINIQPWKPVSITCPYGKDDK